LPPAEEYRDASQSLTLPSLNGGPPTRHQKPTFISVTRGPGMRACLSTGLDTAKGLCLALNIPLVGVHHMQAHALTPRLVSALDSSYGRSKAQEPEFPFLTLLVSGGHTLLLESTSLTAHREIATTTDIAAGDSIDKMARHILPPEILNGHLADTNYGRLLEDFAFPSGEADYEYNAPSSRKEVVAPQSTVYSWTLPPPLRDTRAMTFSFSGLESGVRRIVETGTNLRSESRGRPRLEPMAEIERRVLAREAQRLLFEHLADRIIMALESIRQETDSMPKTVVVSGGVAANRFLRHVLRNCLDARGMKVGSEQSVQLSFPPVALCTDNAAMIAWAGMEMWEAGWHSSLSIKAERRWPLGGDGILGADGWLQRTYDGTLAKKGLSNKEWQAMEGF
jgi:N6-L-threonylcarbamoyladenine synthase